MGVLLEGRIAALQTLDLCGDVSIRCNHSLVAFLLLLELFFKGSLLLCHL